VDEALVFVCRSKAIVVCMNVQQTRNKGKLWGKLN